MHSCCQNCVLEELHTFAVHCRALCTACAPVDCLVRAVALLASLRVEGRAAAGEEPHSGIIAGITGGSPTIVTCVEDERLEFQVCAHAVATRWGGECI